MAHEIAHQWFGNSVTERDWHHIWLSEGFATYFTSYYLAGVYGESRMKSLMQHSRNRIINAVEKDPAPVIDTTITDFMNLLSTYSYQKGAWVLHMLNNEIGEDSFTRAIRTYYSRFRNRTVVTDDFRELVEEISGETLGWFFAQWLYREDLPVIDTRWDYNVKKKELVIYVEQLQDGSPFRIDIEIAVITGGKERLEIIDLDSGSATITLRCDEESDELITDPGVKLLYIPAR